MNLVTLLCHKKLNVKKRRLYSPKHFHLSNPTSRNKDPNFPSDKATILFLLAYIITARTVTYGHLACPIEQLSQSRTRRNPERSRLPHCREEPVSSPSGRWPWGISSRTQRETGDKDRVPCIGFTWRGAQLPEGASETKRGYPGDQTDRRVISFS